MRRRDLLGGISGAVAWIMTTNAQEVGKKYHIGVLHPGFPGASAPDDPGRWVFEKCLRDLGYVEDKNVLIEHLLYAEWNPDRIRSIAADLVKRNVDVIVVVSTTPARVIKEATSTIPIVVSAMADPVGDGLVVSLAHPGANLTGNTFLGPELVAKRFGLLKDAIPGLSDVAGLWHPRAYSEDTMARMVKDAYAAAKSLSLELRLFPADQPAAVAAAFSTMAEQRVGALIVLPSPMLFAQNLRIVELAAEYRLPAMYQAREFVDAGGLMSYGASIPELTRRSAMYVDRILKGAKPADLPVEQPTTFELLINLKTAKALGLTIPQSLLIRADEVIE